MAEDIEPDGDIIDVQSAGQENGNDDIEAQPEDAGIQTKTLIYLDGQVKAGEPLVDKLETTTAEDGLQETTEIRLKSADCGHVVHTGSEAGVSCLSCRRLSKEEPLILCAECAKNPDNVCSICHTACCWECRDERLIDGEQKAVCKACIRSTLRLRMIKNIIKWLLVGAALYWLLRF